MTDMNKEFNNNNFTCEGCMWFDQCGNDIICDNYSPVCEMSDEYIEKLIEENRIEYRKEWFKYTGDSSLSSKQGGINIAIK